MKTRRLSRALVGLIGLGLTLAVPAAWAQATSFSSFTFTLAGTVAGAPEALTCSGPVKVTAMIVKDPSMPANSIVSLDTRMLSCKGATTGAAYKNSGQATLTRLLGPTDQIQTAISLYPSTPDGFMHARTGLATLNLSYNVTTGALAAVSGTLAGQ
ncbi:MAG: hypothetical protein ACM3PC_09120 [Deltaproteobacteria bacterium]